MYVYAVVKVLIFLALLRVEASGQQALKYSTMEEELSDMMRILQNNQNLRLDKRIRLPDEGLPVLRIYLGSDLGFCGSVNTSVSSVLQHDGPDTEKIVIGRKLRRPAEVSVFLTQEEYRENFGVLRTYLERAVRQRPWSAVELVYNHYYNVTSVKQEIKRIYPLAEPEEVVDANAWDDFEIEGDAQELLEDMRRVATEAVDGMSAKKRRDEGDVCRTVRSAVSSYLYKHTKRSPMIIPMVTKL